VQFYAFDVLMSEGDDLRPLPLHLRKKNLARLLRRRVDGIHLAPFEQGEIGPDLFRAACDVGLEGSVSSENQSLPQRVTIRWMLRHLCQTNPTVSTRVGGSASSKQSEDDHRSP
jgi:hypothetical protein